MSRTTIIMPLWKKILVTHAAARARWFLVPIFTYCDVTAPGKVSGAFSSEFSEDFRLRYLEHVAVDFSLQYIQECLECGARTNADFGFTAAAQF